MEEPHKPNDTEAETESEKPFSRRAADLDLDSWLEHFKQYLVKFLKEDCDLGCYFSDELGYLASADLIFEMFEDDGWTGAGIAAETLSTIIKIQECRADRDEDEAIRKAINLGELINQNEFLHEYRAGFGSLAGSRRGGAARRGVADQRNIDMAREFLEARPRSTASDSVLKARIGKRNGLKSRSQAIDAINKGLNKLSD